MLVEKIPIFEKIVRTDKISPVSPLFESAVVTELKSAIGKEVDLKYVFIVLVYFI